MLNTSFDITQPEVIIGYMAAMVLRSSDKYYQIWHKSKVVTERAEAEVIIKQWQTQLGESPTFTYEVIELTTKHFYNKG